MLKMKITKSQLKQIIKEEVSKVLNEAAEPIAKLFIDGGFRGWEAAKARTALEAWTKASGLTWNTHSVAPDGTTYSMIASDPDQEKLRRFLQSDDIEEVIQLYNSTIAPLNVGQLNYKLEWGRGGGLGGDDHTLTLQFYTEKEGQ